MVMVETKLFRYSKSAKEDYLIEFVHKSKPNGAIELNTAIIKQL